MIRTVGDRIGPDCEPVQSKSRIFQLIDLRTFWPWRRRIGFVTLFDSTDGVALTNRGTIVTRAD